MQQGGEAILSPAHYGCTVKFKVSDIPVVGSVAVTSNCTSAVPPEVVVKRPVFESMLTLLMT